MYRRFRGARVFEDDVNFTITQFHNEAAFQPTKCRHAIGQRRVGLDQQVDIAATFGVVGTRAEEPDAAIGIDALATDALIIAR